MDLVRSLLAMLPAAILWGASFPLALAALASPGEDPGALVGGTYAANTLGAIVGAVAFSMILIPGIGTQNAQRLLVALSAAAALIVLVHSVRVWKLAAAVAAVALLAASVQPMPWLATAYGRRMNQYTGYDSRPLYIGEGMNSSIVVSEYPSGVRYFHVSGKAEATTESFDMRLQRMLGHIPALFHPEPQSVLVVGFGAGITAGSFVTHPSVERIVICEIEPLIPPVSSRYFNPQNYNVLNDQRTEIHYDDARHFILTTEEKFDIITSDPIHPWVKGAASLYSKEYLELCRRRLNPGGIVTQWVPLYESDFETVRSEFATFFEVFPNATIWNSDVTNRGYDVVLVGQAEPGAIDIDRLAERLRRGDHDWVAASLAEVGLGSAFGLLATYAGRDNELRPWLEGAQINRDLNMRLQYLAGWGLNFNHPDWLFQTILSHYSFPEDLFQGSSGSVALLRTLLDRQPR